MIHLSAAIIKKGHNKQGFTLLEVIVAISVLTIGLLAVASMQVSAIRGNASAFGLTEATSWASDQVEKLIVLAYDHADLQDMDGDGASGLENDSEATDDNPNPPPTHGKYKVYWNVAVDDTANGTKTVNVIVTWTDHGIQKRVSIRNIIPRT
jgi:prepilin-type N-terminal cleavage/methylation domain-containing protein